MDHLVEKLGITTLNWSYKTECCGASLMITNPDVALEMSEKILRNACEVGADAIVVVCPFCHGNLDTRQDQLAGRTGRRYDMPILYLTQLMGLAFGLHPKDLMLDRHLVSTQPLLEKLQAGTAAP
jgi:heterodisulfide reductase subunit B